MEWPLLLFYSQLLYDHKSVEAVESDTFDHVGMEILPKNSPSLTSGYKRGRIRKVSEEGTLPRLRNEQHIGDYWGLHLKILLS